MNIDFSQWTMVIVLFAAAMHATWNAMLKISGERMVVMMLITLGCAVPALMALPFVGLPHPASYPYIIASGIVHFGYAYTLCKAYEMADFSASYPIARGSAPALVLFFGFLFLNEQLSLWQTVGVLLVTTSILTLALQGLKQQTHLQGVAFAGLCACFIASYSVIDGVGSRLAGSPHSYAALLFVSQFLPIGVYVILRYRRSAVMMLKSNWRLGFIAGFLSLVSYWIAIWAMSIVPVAVVVALRETSVIFAIFIGAFFLKERFNLQRAMATCLAACGVGMIKS